MQITRVELRDIKSYVDSKPIPFLPGVNAICGPNGAGKSTIVEAIGFALFDAPPHVQRLFVREGAKSGEIVVSFVDALDEREYQIVRPVSGGSSYIYDPEIKRKIVTGKADVIDWLKEHMGIEPTLDLRALFEDAVAVPQGLLAASFLEGEATRKTKFDPLLQVDDYETAWEKLREAVRYVDDQLGTQQKHIAHLQGELKPLAKHRKEAKDLIERISQDKTALQSVEEQLKEVAAEKQKLDASKARIDALSLDIRAIVTNLRGLLRQLNDAETAVTRAQTAQRILAEVCMGYEAYEVALKQLMELDEQRATRDELRSRLAEAEQELARVDQEVAGLNKTLEEIEAAVAHLAVLQPSVEQQGQLEAELERAKETASQLKHAQRSQAEEEKRLNSLEKQRGEVRQKLKRLSALQDEIGQLKKQKKAQEQERFDAESRCKMANLQRIELKKRLSLLEEMDEAVCPVCRRPLDPHQVEGLAAHYQEELNRLKAHEQTLKGHVDTKQKELANAEDKLTCLGAEADSLPRPNREKELSKKIRNQKAKVKRRKDKAARLAGSPERVTELESQLAAMGDPRSEWKIASAEAEKHAKTETELAGAVRAQENAIKMKASLDEELEAFEDLDNRIGTQTDIRDKNEADHRNYLENSKLAEGLEESLAKLNSLVLEHEEALAQQDQLRKELNELEATYDENAHEALVEEHGKFSEKRAKLRGQIDLRREQLSEVEDEIRSLEGLQVNLNEAEAERDILERLSGVLEFIRKTIRQAGPHVTRVLVQTISAEANRIFGEIVNDYTMRLRWNEDYSITVEQQGGEREFSQLSGGEKMVAALAVRLALLREMSDIRIAFFDEPTAHLDDEWRDNLAGQITQIEGFNQLFVISHDDTFERETHHILRVAKENGISRVEVG